MSGSRTVSPPSGPAAILAVGNFTGGVGKSTPAVNLVAELAQGRKVHLVDADAQATAAEWHTMGAGLPFTREALPLDDAGETPTATRLAEPTSRRRLSRR
jgi:cellulose biosynthesis protein BcsQ